MKTKYFTIPVLTLVLSFLVVTGFIFYHINNALTSGAQSVEMIIPDKIPAYHFSMIYKDVDDPVSLSIKKGIERASMEFNVAVEFNGPGTYNEDELMKYLDIAVASKVDGIVTYVWDEEQTGAIIDRAVKHEIPVVTIDTDAKKSKRAAFVGENTYNSGVQIGRMIVAATGEKGEAVILNGKDQGSEATVQNLMILGIRDALKQYPDIHVTTKEYNSSDFIGIEDAVSTLLMKNSQLSTIICTSEKDTAIVAERLIDLNKVGYNIIGYGESPEILRYIEKGVVFGTLVVDHEQMGYETIRVLTDIKQEGRTSAYFTVDTFPITKKNVSEFLKAGEE